MALPKAKQTKLPPIGLRLLPDEMKALQKIANEEGRHLAVMAQRLLAEILRDKGFLK